MKGGGSVPRTALRENLIGAHLTRGHGHGRKNGARPRGPLDSQQVYTDMTIKASFSISSHHYIIYYVGALQGSVGVSAILSTQLLTS